MKTNKNLKKNLKETVKPTSQQLNELVQSLASADIAQKLKQTKSAFTNSSNSRSVPTTSISKVNSIGNGNTISPESWTSRTYGANTSGFDNIVETWEKEKAAQERINRQQAPSVNAIGSTNNLTNNNSGVMPQELSALNQALEAYHRNTLAKGPSTDSGTKSTVFNTASYADPSATTSKSSRASTTKQADGLYYDASDGSYTRMVNGKPYKITYKDSRYGTIRNEYNKTHTSDIMYDMDTKGVITKYVNGTPNMVRPDEARYARVATEFLAANIGDQTNQGIRDLAKKYPALQVNWWDNGGDDTITIGLQNTREPLITLTDEYEDGTYTSTNGIITCQLQKGGNYVIAAQPTATTSNTVYQKNTSLDRYTNRPQMVSRDGSIDTKRVAAVNGTGTSGKVVTNGTWSVPGTKSLEMDNVGNFSRTMTNGNSYPVSVSITDQYKRVLKEYLSNKPGEGLRDLLKGTLLHVNWDNKNKAITISYTTTTTRQDVTLAKLTDEEGDGKYSTKDGDLTCKLQNGKMLITSKPSGSINTTLYNNSNLYKQEADLLSQVNQIDTDFDNELENFKEAYKKNIAIYTEISKRTGLPPELIAAIHYRESGCDFSTYLHNGDPLGKPTTHVPVGKYFDDFTDAAVDALLSKKSIRDNYCLNANSNDIAAMLAFAESYNGLGYYNNNRISPYVFSGTTVYKSGKYVADGKYNSNVIDGQPGIYILLMALK